MEQTTKSYLQEIGRKGGKKSRRVLDPEFAKRMVLLREARKAYQKYYTKCFWSYDPEYKITMNDISWVGENLLKNGDSKLWVLGKKLCL